MSREAKTPADFDDAVAVIGMAGRFPGARNVEEFWENLRQGIESVCFFSDEELAASGVTAEEMADPAYVKAGGFLEGADLFDADFFGFSAQEASLTDPQHRLLLECARTALDDAGFGLEIYGGLVGIFAGVGLNRYLLSALADRYRSNTPARNQELVTHNDKDYAVTRAAYKLGLSGPAISVQTASSTSLVAIHMACESLRHGECDMALAGGVSLHCLTKSGYFTNDGMIRSPDGHTRSFDARAKGTVPGSGVGLVVLKRFEDAVAENDSIHAVIRGSAVNNDGARRPGYGVPSLEGEADVVAEALAVARIEPSSVSYVEAHGSGTPMGDAIEVAALAKVFRKGKPGSCALGSVHPNIGHLGVAAGVAGFIKTVLQLRHRKLVPTLHYEKPNPNIDFSRTPFYVNLTPSEWLTDGSPRLAGVSSFGLGGTNAHVVLQEAPTPAEAAPQPPRSQVDRFHLLPLSARSPAALRSLAQATRDWLVSSGRGVPLSDLSYTAGVRRSHHDHRLGLAFRSVRELVGLLEAHLRHETPPGLSSGQRLPDRRLKLAFVFPPSPWKSWNLAKNLARNEPAFRASLKACSEALFRRSGWSLTDALQAEGPLDRLGEADVVGPVLLSLQVSLAELWRSWGVATDAVVGQGAGEAAAACVKGSSTLDDAMETACKLGRDGAPSAEPSLFGEAVGGLLDSGCNVFLEVGPDPVLSKDVAKCLDGQKREGHVYPSPVRGEGGPQAIVGCLGFLYALGYPVDWRKACRPGRLVRLPAHPLESQRYWVEAVDQATGSERGR